VNDSIFGADIFTIGNHNLTDNFVTTVYEDKSHNAWILTRSGITFCRLITDEELYTLILHLKHHTKNPTIFADMNSVAKFGSVRPKALSGNSISIKNIY